MAVQRDKVIASAEKLVGKGKIEPAIKEYERLLEDNPNDVNTLNRIGDLWVRINRNDEAVKVYGRIADHYSRDGFFLKAIAIYKKINKLDPSKLDIYAKLADLYAKQGLAMEAKSQYQVLADFYLKHGEPQNALGIYRKISELDPNSINVHVKLADLYSQNSQTAEALKEYDRVGKMLLKRGMLDEAVQVFRKALRIDPKNTDLIDSLVTTLIEAKDWENARQIVEAGLEANRESPRLLAMMGRVQMGRGDADAAKATLEKAVAADPNDSSVRESLADLFLRQSQPDKALEAIVPLVERAMGRGERAAAIENLNRILRIDPGHAGTLERLIAVYTRLNEETNVLSAMNSLAEAYIAANRWDEASKTLDKLIQREPQNAQHRTKLQFVRSHLTGNDTLPPRTQAPPVQLPPMEIEEPVPSFDLNEEASPSLSLDFDSAPSFELDVPPAPAPKAPEPPKRLVPAVEMVDTGAEDGSDDLDFITEHLTEAEVFSKYGLAEKAAEHLRAVLDRAPKNLTAHERLFHILLEEGDVEAARTAADAYVTLLAQSGNTAPIQSVRNEFLTRGHVYEPSIPGPALRPQAATPAPEPAVGFGLSSPTELEFELDTPEPAMELEESIEVEEEIDLTPEESPIIAEPVEIEELPTPLAAFNEGAAIEELEFTPEAAIEEEVEFELTGPELTLDEEVEVETVGEELSAGAFEPTLDDALLDEPTPAPLGAIDEVSEELIAGEPEVEELESPIEFAAELPQAEEAPLEFEEIPLEAEQSPTEILFEPLAEEPQLIEEVESLEAEAATEAEPAEPPVEPFGEFEPFAAAEAQEPTLEELGEIDFYIEQELLEEAKSRLEALRARFGTNTELAMRDKVLSAAMKRAAAPAAEVRSAPQPPATPAPPAPPTPPAQAPPSAFATPHALSRAEIESELLSAIPDDDEEPIIPAPAAVAPVPAPMITASPAHEGNLFADEEDFFDLAAELESELAEEEEPISLSEEEQSLEEIFKEFKKGVEQQLDVEDYDTHYNLGIAYKEMGLIDEAIGEFQLASKDPKRAVECSSMLGLCFLEKGMPQLAIKWYRKGLEMPEISHEEQIGLLYDLGVAYQETGDTDAAQRAFMEVYGMNSGYRDIVGRIKQLADARK